jgi:RimJ/RimL family protein N-acetyltransferase
VTTASDSSLPKLILTERLVLRPLSENDEEAVFGILNDETTTAGVSWRQHTREGARAWLDRRIENERTRGVNMWAVEQRSSSEVVGLCGFFPSESQLELGYVIHARFWRRGFAKEAARACVEQAVRSGYCIYATIRPMNRASVRIAESAGLRLTRKIEDERGGLLLYEAP